MLDWVKAVAAPQRLLEQRINLDGQIESVALFRRIGRLAVIAEQSRALAGGGVQHSGQAGALAAHLRGQRLAARDQDTIETAGGDAIGVVTDQPLTHVPAYRGVEALAGVDAQVPRQGGRGIGIRRRQYVETR